MRRRTLTTAAALGVVLAGCGRNVGSAIEMTHRMDVFLLEDVSSCAVGYPCTAADASACFHFSDDAGPVPGLLFDRASLQVVPPDQVSQTDGTLRHCFHAVMTAEQVAQTREDLRGLADKVSSLTDGEILLDVRVHEVAAAQLPYTEWSGGIWVAAPGAATILVPALSTATDFAFTIQGDLDPATGYRFRRPGASSCVYLSAPVTGLGVPEYAYLLLPCALHAEKLMFGWLDSLRHVQHEVMGVPDAVYANRVYPACRQGNADATQWFPYPGDCDDPDSPTCGTSECTTDQHLSHVLTAHWKRGRPLIGNHCRNGEQDFDETAVDRGGACARLGVRR